jgi:hypothetical protein
MRYLIAALFIAGMVLAARAQNMSGMGAGHPGHTGLEHKAGPPKRKVDEKAYKSALDTLPDKKFDPWGGVREAPKPK